MKYEYWCVKTELRTLFLCSRHSFGRRFQFKLSFRLKMFIFRYSCLSQFQIRNRTFLKRLQRAYWLCRQYNWCLNTVSTPAAFKRVAAFVWWYWYQKLGVLPNRLEFFFRKPYTSAQNSLLFRYFQANLFFYLLLQSNSIGKNKVWMKFVRIFFLAGWKIKKLKICVVVVLIFEKICNRHHLNDIISECITNLGYKIGNSDSEQNRFWKNM